MRNLRKPVAALAVAILLISGCGGGGGDGPPPIALFAGSEVPVTATQNAAGAVAFVAQQQAMSSESADLVVLGDAVLATDDSAEPSDV